MKNFKNLAIALLCTISFVGANAQTMKVDASKSTINWLAKKVTGQHSGTVNVQNGTLIFKKKKLAGGNITVDMTSLTATDLSGEYQGKLNGHLKSDDFFGTDKFSTCSRSRSTSRPMSWRRSSSSARPSASASRRAASPSF